MSKHQDSDLAAEGEASFPWRDILGAALRHWKMVVALALLCTVVAAINLFLSPPVYMTTSTLLLQPKRVEIAVSPEEGSAARLDRIDATALNSEATFLRSDALVRDALGPLRPELDVEPPRGWADEVRDLILLPVRLPGLAYRWMHGAGDPTMFDNWVASVQNRLEVIAVPQTNVIRVSFRDRDPDWAAEFVNRLVSERIKRQTSLSQSKETAGFFEEQSRLLATRVHDAEVALQAFYDREGLLGGSEERDGLRERLQTVRASLATANTELAEARVRVAYLGKALAEIPKAIESTAASSGSSSVSVENRVLELSLQRTELLSRYTPQSAKIRDLDQQIEQARQLLQDEKKLIASVGTMPNPTYQSLEMELLQARAQLAALEARAAKLQEQDRDALSELRKVVDRSETMEQLELDLEQAKSAHRSYARKLETARLSNALDASEIMNISVIEEATTPPLPMESRKAPFVLGALLGGLLLGTGLAYARDRANPAVMSAHEVARLTGLRVIGEVSE